jgi:parvulin-like peptidyl-prolyl isomerase
MRHWSLPAALLIVLSAPAAIAAPAPRPAAPKAAAKAPKPAAPMATVNGVAIARAEFDRQLNQTKKRYGARFGLDFTTERGKQIEQEIRASLIDHLVERQLILNEAAKRKVVVTPAQVDAKIAELSQSLPPGTDIQQALVAQGMTLKDLQSEVHDGLVIQAVAGAITAGAAVEATDEEVEAYYNGHLTEYDRPEEVRVRHILVKDKAKAEELLGQLKGGANFEGLAKSHSEDTGSGAEGGDLGFFGKGRMVPEFEEAAFKLKPGELSGLVQTQFGYHILQGVERREARRVPLAEANDEIKTKLSEERKDAALTTWLAEQKKAAKVTYAPGFDPKTLKPSPKPSAKPSAKPDAKPQAKPSPSRK